jgi:hypothetical protein
MGLLSAAVVGLLLTANGPARKPASGAPECRKDADCVLIADGCCGCEAGGKQRAVPANRRPSLEKRRKSGCRETVCAAMISEDPSCKAKAVCQEGACALGF